MTICKRTRVLPLLTAVVLLLTILFIPVGTAGADHDPFRDVSQGKWYTEAVLYCYEQGYVSGYEDGTFRPDGDLTRAEMAVIMDRMLDLTEKDHRSFADVKSGKWYTDAVLRCAKAGVMSGYGNGSFGTGDRLTREQGTLILARAFDVPVDTGRTSFADDGSISDWAVGAVKAMAGRVFVRGTGGNRFEPGRTLTRPQLYQIPYAARTDPGHDDPS